MSVNKDGDNYLLTYSSDEEIFYVEDSLGKNRQHLFVLIKNNTDAVLFVDYWRSLCSCVELKRDWNVLAAGESKLLEIIADTSGYSGRIEKMMPLKFHLEEFEQLVWEFSDFVPVRFEAGGEEKEVLSEKQKNSAKTKLKNSFNILKVKQDVESAIKNTNSQESIYFFYNTDCKECEYIKNDLLPRVLSELGLKEEKVLLVDVEKKNGYEKLFEVEKKAGSNGGVLPAFFVHGKIYYGKEALETMVNY
ncbi:MAG: hypothetical protein U9O87_00015 [Verrucomicrobiota bacterium]|nr:hypothetical protein [Verrucomicrobiota bacterium]